MRLISIIIPVYNVEKYLDRCIKSVLNQTYKNMEIILVDDGSPDNCPKICDDWAKKDDRIKVIHKENGGLGYARNSGLEMATGDYVLFIDSDDYIDSHLLSDIISSVDKYGKSDLIYYGHRKVDSSGNVSFEMIPNTPQDIYIEDEVQNKLLPEVLGKSPYVKEGYSVNNMSAWCWAYRVDVLRKNNFRFVSERDIISEDIYSLLNLMSDIKRVTILKKSYYNYCLNTASLTKTYKPDRFEKIVDFYVKSKGVCNDKNYNDDVILRLNAPFLTNVLDCLKSEVKSIKINGFKSQYRRIQHILSNEELKYALNSYPSRQYTLKRRILQFCMKRKWVLALIAIIMLKR